MVLDPSTIDWMITEAQRSIVEGTLYEPRAYYDIVQLPSTAAAGSVVTPGTTGAFTNTEQFPVRLTRMTISLLFGAGETTPSFPDERLMQEVALRLRVHDSYYQSRVCARLPLWQNELPSISSVVAPGVSVWHFDRPLVLSSRDTLQIIGQILDGLAPSRTVSVGFHGAGYITRRLYYLEGSKSFTASPMRFDFDQAPYRNDGSEPIVIHTMVMRVSALATALDPTGDTRAAALFASQIGNGTNAPWIHTPPLPFATPFNGVTACPVALLGGDGGRAIIHRFIGTGLVLEPGEGVDIDAQALSSIMSPGPVGLGVGMLGYIAVR